MRIFKNQQYYYDISEASTILNVSLPAFSQKRGRYGAEQLERIMVDGKVFVPVSEVEKILEERELRQHVGFVMEFLVKGLPSKVFRHYFSGCIIRADAVAKTVRGKMYSYRKAVELEPCMKPFEHLYYDWLETDMSEADFLKIHMKDRNTPAPDWSKSFLIQQYWQLQKTVPTIAAEFGTNETFIYSKIREYGLQKKKNGIRMRGKKGYRFSEEEKIKRQKQPHAQRVTAIDAHTLKIVKTYRSIAATEEDGFRRENVSKALRTTGVHKGHLWAREGMEEGVIRVAQKRGLEKKLDMLQRERPSKEWLQEHYIEKNMTLEACAKLWGSSKTPLLAAMEEFGIFKKKNIPKLDADILLRELLAGNTTAEIAAAYGRKKETIQTYIWRWKVREKLQQRSKDAEKVQNVVHETEERYRREYCA